MSNQLRFVTWNSRGPVQRNGKYAHLAAIQFDVAALQECEALPLGSPTNTVSTELPHGSGTRCISILSPHKLQRVGDSPECSVAAYVDGPHGTFLFISIWIKPIPTGAGVYKYVRRLPPIFDWAKEKADGLPLVIAGDFNCNGSFERGRGKEFRSLADGWTSEHGLESAWHQKSGFPLGVKEDPTWIPSKKGVSEFMIDYIFIPTDWKAEVVRVQEPWGSDHRPLIADVRVT